MTSLSILFCKFALSQTFMMLMHFLLLCMSSSCWILNWIWSYISYVFAQKQKKKKVWFNDEFHYLSKSSENYSKIVHSHSLSLLCFKTVRYIIFGQCLFIYATMKCKDRKLGGKKVTDNLKSLDIHSRICILPLIEWKQHNRFRWIFSLGIYGFVLFLYSRMCSLI